MPFGKAYTGVDDPELVRDGYDSAVRYLSDIYQEIFSALEEDFDYIITVSDHGELLGEHHGMWNHVSGIYPELTHVPLVISGLEKEDCDSTVSILDLYTTILELAGVDNDQDGSQILTSPRDSRTYLAEYRGPFDRSLERAKSEELNIDEYGRNLFVLAESGYYGYQDYDGWREVSNSPRANPQNDLDEFLDRMGMRRLQVDDDGDLDDGVEDRLERLGYM
jgi:arylsulfatase